LRKSVEVEAESSVRGERKVRWEVVYDFQKVPADNFVDLIFEVQSPGELVGGTKELTMYAFEVQVETAELNQWILLPEGKEYHSYQILRHLKEKPETVEAVNVVTEYMAADMTILAFKLLSVKPGYRYEILWFYE
jgi:hypothetical protein